MLVHNRLDAGRNTWQSQNHIRNSRMQRSPCPFTGTWKSSLVSRLPQEVCGNWLHGTSPKQIEHQGHVKLAPFTPISIGGSQTWRCPCKVGYPVHVAMEPDISGSWIGRLFLRDPLLGSMLMDRRVVFTMQGFTFVTTSSSLECGFKRNPKGIQNPLRDG